MSDELRCYRPDCLRYIDHPGPHEYPWGDSIPWPPEADLDESPAPVGVLPVEDDEQSQRLGGITW